jgi:isopenicillin N synthase-like dioxygenase
LQYPSLSSGADYTADDIRAGAHSDYGSITLLFQMPGQPGLEILTPENEWSPVPVNPHNDKDPPILVNIGDLLSYWTNGLLKSTVHRVIFPKGDGAGAADRYSMAYFCHPQDDAKLLPVPSPVVQECGQRNGKLVAEDVITARDHLNNRLAATYGIK